MDRGRDSWGLDRLASWFSGYADDAGLLAADAVGCALDDLSFLTCYYFGYHLEHHLYPNVPWWRLPERYAACKLAGGDDHP